MEALQNSVFQRLPLLSLDNSEMMGARELQKISSKSIEDLTANGPRIIAIGGEMKAVLVDYKQFTLLQKRFTEMVKLTSLVNQFIPKFLVPEGHTVSINKLKIEISGTLQKIASESPESSPFTDLMDAMLALSSGIFENSVPAPLEMRENAKIIREKNSKKSGAKGVKPKKHITE